MKLWKDPNFKVIGNFDSSTEKKAAFYALVIIFIALIVYIASYYV